MTPEERERARHEIRKHYQLDGGWRQNPPPWTIDFFVGIGRVLAHALEMIKRHGKATTLRVADTEQLGRCPRHDHGYARRLCDCGKP